MSSAYSHSHSHSHCHTHTHSHNNRQNQITAARRSPGRQRYEDPTHTRSIASAYESRLRGAYDRINTVVNEWVRDEDLFELRASSFELIAEPSHPNPRNYQFLNDWQKANQFEQWMLDAQESEVLQVVTIDENRYVARAYERGIEHANADLREAGIDVEAASEIFDQPIHQRRLRELYARNFEGTPEYGGLVGMTDDVAQSVREELTQGLAEGINPRETAERITDRVNSVGKTRAEQIARTETLHSHNDGFLTRLEQTGIDEVAIEAEILTHPDHRRCDICEPLHGQVMTIRQARREGPPFHAQCRCSYRARFN